MPRECSPLDMVPAMYANCNLVVQIGKIVWIYEKGRYTTTDSRCLSELGLLVGKLFSKKTCYGADRWASFKGVNLKDDICFPLILYVKPSVTIIYDSVTSYELPMLWLRVVLDVEAHYCRLHTTVLMTIGAYHVISLLLRIEEINLGSEIPSSSRAQMFLMRLTSILMW